MSRVFQRPDRGGYYLGVPVPYELRKKLKKSEVVRKLGNTYKEANIKRHQVEAKVQREFGAELNKLSLVEEVTTMYESDKNFKGIKSLAEIPEKEKDIIKAAHPIDLDSLGNPTTPEEAALWEALNGKTTYQQWINRRLLVENISKSTINGWKTKLSKLAEWKGSDYLADLTKKEAIQFKDHLLSKGHEGSAVKNIIGTLNGFWNWLMENDLAKENVWNGLKKRLPDADKKPLPPREVLIRATEKANTIGISYSQGSYTVSYEGGQLSGAGGFTGGQGSTNITSIGEFDSSTKQKIQKNIEQHKSNGYQYTKYSNYKGSLNQIRHVDTTNMDMGKPPWKDSEVSKNWNGLYKYFNEGGQSTPGDTYTNEDWENQKGF